MTFLTLTYQLTVHRTEDRSGDEPRLEFAFVAGRDRAEVTVVDTGRLASGFPARRAFAAGTNTLNRAVHVPFEPNVDEPFLGFAVRALEEDNSRNSDRRRDRRALAQLLEDGLDPIFRRGATPTATDIFVIANGAPVTDNFGDDDDKIGVSARVFPTIGNDLDGRAAGSTVGQSTLRFVEDGADWEMDFQLLATELI